MVRLLMIPGADAYELSRLMVYTLDYLLLYIRGPISDDSDAAIDLFHFGPVRPPFCSFTLRASSDRSSYPHWIVVVEILTTRRNALTIISFQGWSSFPRAIAIRVMKDARIDLCHFGPVRPTLRCSPFRTFSHRSSYPRWIEPQYNCSSSKY